MAAVAAPPPEDPKVTALRHEVEELEHKVSATKNPVVKKRLIARLGSKKKELTALLLAG